MDCTTTTHEEERINKDVVYVEGPTKRKRQEEKRLRDVQVWKAHTLNVNAI